MTAVHNIFCLTWWLLDASAVFIALFCSVSLGTCDVESRTLWVSVVTSVVPMTIIYCQQLHNLKTQVLLKSQLQNLTREQISSIKQCLNFFPWRNPLKQLTTTLRSTFQGEEKNIKGRLLAHWGYSITSNCRTNIFAVFRGIFVIFCNISKQLCTYSTVSRGAHNDVLWNRGTLFDKHWYKPSECEIRSSRLWYAASSHTCKLCT